VVATGEPNVKPKAGVVDVAEEETVVEPDGVPVVDGEVDAESEVEGKPVSVGIAKVPMVLATSIFPEGMVVVVADPDAVAAPAQSVADTVTVETMVTVTMLFVPMTTVGVAIPEEDVVGVILEMELETLDDGLRVGSDDVVAVVEEDEEVKI
jgi:hypothetical protein